MGEGPRATRQLALGRVDLARARASLRLRALGARDRARGRGDRLVPSRRTSPGDHSDFATQGDVLADHLAEHAGLHRGSRVLEVGCGRGRVARALTARLGPEGSYAGVDADPDAVGWCRRHYRGRAGFRFVVADTHDAARSPEQYRLPFDPGSFDLVVVPTLLASALPAACEHHLAEAARVLAPGGTLAATFFALNDTSRALMATGSAGLQFADPDELVAVLDEELPDEAVAYADEWIFERLRERGLTLTGLHPGSWCGREEFVGFQDLLVAVRDA